MGKPTGFMEYERAVLKKEKPEELSKLFQKVKQQIMGA